MIHCTEKTIHQTMIRRVLASNSLLSLAKGIVSVRIRPASCCDFLVAYIVWFSYEFPFCLSCNLFLDYIISTYWRGQSVKPFEERSLSLYLKTLKVPQTCCFPDEFGNEISCGFLKHWPICNLIKTSLPPL